MNSQPACLACHEDHRGGPCSQPDNCRLRDCWKGETIIGWPHRDEKDCGPNWPETWENRSPVTQQGRPGSLEVSNQ